jgi:hypothetical protein
MTHNEPTAVAAFEAAMPADKHRPPEQRATPTAPGLAPSPRASDADRDAALERLRDAFADGRLSGDEFDQRANSAFSARTVGELERLFLDLPVAPVAPGPPLAEERPVRLTLGILGGTWRRWRWRVAPRSSAVALLGACRLDLRGAKLSAPVTTITAFAIAGAIDVVVPPGVRVELNAYGLLCDVANRVPEQDLPAEAPLLRVRLFGLLSAVETKPRFRFETRPGLPGG